MEKTLMHIMGKNGADGWTVIPTASLDGLLSLFNADAVEWCKCYETDNIEVEDLPEATQKEIKNILRSFRRCTVEFEHGEFHVTIGTILTRSYDPWHFMVGEYMDRDVYNFNERIENYVNSFHCYPAEYKGAKDWQRIHDASINWKMVDGNLIPA